MIKPKDTKLRKFRDWLEINGAELLPSTSEYELVRFRTKKGISLFCVDKYGTVTSIIGETKRAWECFATHRYWNGGLKTKRRPIQGKLRKDSILAIADRDGWNCAYCGKRLNIYEASIEHVIPITRGGEDSLRNIVLTCFECNRNAGAMNIRQKIDFAVGNRKKLQNDID